MEKRSRNSSRGCLKTSQVNIAILSSLASFATRKGIPFFLVGGAVRDLLLNRYVKDIDVAMAGDALALAREWADLARGSYVLLDENHAIARVVLSPELYVDFAALQGTITQDLLRRDFTINAMALPLTEETIGKLSLLSESTIKNTPNSHLNSSLNSPFQEILLDPAGGLADLHQNVVKALSKENLIEDPLRILRAIRLAGKLNFSLEPETYSLLVELSAYINKVAAERIKEELVQILSSKQSFSLIQLLKETDLLFQIFPEFKALLGIRQGKNHDLDVWGHTMAAYKVWEDFLNTPDNYFNQVSCSQNLSEKVKKHLKEPCGNVTRGIWLKFGILLHDIGKPETRRESQKGITFYKHDKIGAEKVKKIAQRLKLSNKEKGLLVNVVLGHLRPLLLYNEPKTTKRAMYRFFREYGSSAVDILAVSWADFLGKGDLDPKQVQEYQSFLLCMFEEYFDVYLPVSSEPLLNGSEIIKLLKLKPGPQVGVLVEKLLEAQVLGEVKDRAQAEAFLINIAESS